jgi:hypothetical protein
MSEKSKLRRAVKHRAKAAPKNVGPRAMQEAITAAIADKQWPSDQPAKAAETAPVAAEKKPRTFRQRMGWN